jgi:hypothetical protein
MMRVRLFKRHEQPLARHILRNVFAKLPVGQVQRVDIGWDIEHALDVVVRKEQHAVRRFVVTLARLL